MGAPEIVRKGQRQGIRPAPPATGQPGPSGPLQIVALPPCPRCGMPEGCHPTLPCADGSYVPVCPEPIAHDTGGPADWLPSEGTLLRLLKRHYGWVQLEAGQLVRHRQ